MSLPYGFERHKNIISALKEFHRKRCGDRKKLGGFSCDCDPEFQKMLAFREVYDKWLS